jgi:hypothetical protein
LSCNKYYENDAQSNPAVIAAGVQSQRYRKLQRPNLRMKRDKLKSSGAVSNKEQVASFDRHSFFSHGNRLPCYRKEPFVERAARDRWLFGCRTGQAPGH